MATQSNNAIALEDLCSLVVEQVKPENAEGSVYIGLEHVSPGKIFADSSGYAEDVQSHKYVFCKNDVLYGKLRPYLDKAVLAKTAGICTTELLVLRPKENVSPLFLACALHNKEFVDYAMEGVTGVQHPRTSWAHIKNYEIGELPLETLHKIGMLMAAIQQASFNNAKLLKLANDLKHATMHKLFTCGLRSEPQKETEIGLVPESWEVCHLETIASLERGRFMHRPRNEPRFYGGHMPFIQTGDVVRSGGYIKEYTQTLNEDGIRISRVFPIGTILITIAANIGYTGILQTEAACPDSLIAITPTESVIAQYLHYYLQTQQPKMDQAAPKGTQKNINIQFLSPWPVPVPPTKNEQQQIADILDAIDQKIDLHRRKKAVLEELFKSLLHKLMTGEIRVDDLDFSALEDMQPQPKEVPHDPVIHW